MNALKMKNVSKIYPDFTLNNLSFELESGYFLGLIGPNGAGKSTTLKMLLDLVVPDSGQIDFWNTPLKGSESQIKQRIGFILEEDFLFEDITINQFEKIIAPFYKQWDKERFFSLIRKFSLPENKKIKKLSKGMKMKIQLATALSHHAEMLILDEPFNALDPIARYETLELLRKQVTEEGLTVIVSSHITTELDKVADYIAFLDNGELLLYDTRIELLEESWIIQGDKNLLDEDLKSKLEFILVEDNRFQAFSRESQLNTIYEKSHFNLTRPKLEEIMVIMLKGEKQ